ncbi:MAG: hypothetical protein ACYDBJ_12925 [Aggregatilineales bacterium]
MLNLQTMRRRSIRKCVVNIGLFLTWLLVVTNVSNVLAQTATPISLNTFRTAAFSLQYPAGWQITAHGDTETYIGPGTSPVCAQPGVLITLLGRQPANKTADTLFDDYQAVNSYLTGVEARADVGDLGRTAVLRGPCTDGSTRDLRVSVYIAFGNGYRLTAFAPHTQFKGWDDVYKQIAASFTPVIPGANGQSGQPVHAPDHAPPTLVIHVFRGNVYMANVADLPGVPLTHDADVITNTRRYAEARIAPDGKRVAFVSMPGGDVYVAPIAKDATAAKLPVQIATPYPIAWSPDGTQIAYVSAASDGKLTVNVAQIAGGTARPVGTLSATSCAPVKTDDPAAATWAADLSAADANGDRLLLEWPATNTLLVSSDCTGASVSKLDATSGKLTPLSTLSRAVLSPDKTQLAGITGGKLAIVDVAGGQARPLPISADQVVWGSDSGSLLYATRTIKTPLSLSATVVGVAAFQSAVYDLSLHRYTLTGAQDDTLYTGMGFAIGSIAPSPDGSGLIFTVIQDDSTLITTLGKATQALSEDDVLRTRPAAQAYWLPFPAVAGTVPTLLIDTLQAQFGPSGSTATIGVPVTPQRGATNIPGG